MRWLTPEQWAMTIRATIVAVLAALPFGGPTVEVNPPTPTGQHMGEAGARVSLSDTRSPLNDPASDAWRRRRDLSDDLEAFKNVEEAEEGSESNQRKEDDDPPDWAPDLLDPKIDDPPYPPGTLYDPKNDVRTYPPPGLYNTKIDDLYDAWVDDLLLRPRPHDPKTGDLIIWTINDDPKNDVPPPSPNLFDTDAEPKADD